MYGIIMIFCDHMNKKDTYSL